MIIKDGIRRVAASLGYEIKRLPANSYVPHVNPYADQRQLLRTAGTKMIFDVGANEGGTATKYHALFPDAQIYGFEPSDDAFAVFSDRFSQTPNIKCIQAAVSSRAGREKFFLNKYNQTNSLLPVSQESDKYVDAGLTNQVGVTEVETLTLDEFCRERNIQKIDLLKMDIQGGELLALQGAEALLTNHAISIIYTEVLFAKLYDKQANFHDLAEFLTRRGYVLYGLYNLNYGKNGVLGWGDAIFISPRMEQML